MGKSALFWIASNIRNLDKRSRRYGIRTCAAKRTRAESKPTLPIPFPTARVRLRLSFARQQNSNGAKSLRITACGMGKIFRRQASWRLRNTYEHRDHARAPANCRSPIWKGVGTSRHCVRRSFPPTATIQRLILKNFFGKSCRVIFRIYI